MLPYQIVQADGDGNLPPEQTAALLTTASYDAKDKADAAQAAAIAASAPVARGFATLSGGDATVVNSAVRSDSIVLLTAIGAGAVVNCTGRESSRFFISSGDTGDSRQVGYVVFNPL